MAKQDSGFPDEKSEVHFLLLTVVFERKWWAKPIIRTKSASREFTWHRPITGAHS